MRPKRSIVTDSDNVTQELHKLLQEIEDDLVPITHVDLGPIQKQYAHVEREIQKIFEPLIAKYQEEAPLPTTVPMNKMTLDTLIPPRIRHDRKSGKDTPKSPLRSEPDDRAPTPVHVSITQNNPIQPSKVISDTSIPAKPVTPSLAKQPVLTPQKDTPPIASEHTADDLETRFKERQKRVAQQMGVSDATTKMDI